MPQLIDIKVPDLGDFDNVPVIEVFVSNGDQDSQGRSPDRPGE